MEIFYSDDIQGSILTLPAEEAAHCVRVLRHRPGDPIDVIDGRGTLYHCTLLDSASVLADTPSGAGIDLPFGGGSKNGRKCSTPQGLGVGGASKTAKNDAAPFRSRGGHGASVTVARIDSSEPGWHSHPYRLTLAVCPTKNPDRYEWMAEKATEVGLDVLVPVIGDRSERKVLGKEERLAKILLSAAKQSLKGAVPQLAAPVSVRDFIASLAPIPGATPAAASSLRLIAYCSDEVQPRASIMALLREFWHSAPTSPEVIVLIGPEGDFSPEEVRAAIAAGFIPVSLGSSRLRTETAAVTAAEAVYLSLL